MASEVSGTDSFPVSSMAEELGGGSGFPFSVVATFSFSLGTSAGGFPFCLGDKASRCVVVDFLYGSV